MERATRASSQRPSTEKGVKRVNTTQALNIIKKQGAKHEDPTGQRTKIALNHNRIIQQEQALQDSQPTPEELSNLDEADTAAAHTLVQLKHEGNHDLRRLIRKSGSLPAAMTSLITYNHTSVSQKQEIEDFLTRQRKQDTRVHGAMSLITLSGQDTKDSKAALMLMKMKHEGRWLQRRRRSGRLGRQRQRSRRQRRW